MTDLLEDMRRLQGLEEEKKKKNLLPRAVLIIASVALVIAMVIRLQYKYDKSDPNETSHLQPAVLTKKLSDSADQPQTAVQVTEDSRRTAASRPEVFAGSAAAAGSERPDTLRSGPSEQPDLEKAIDMLMKRRSPKY